MCFLAGHFSPHPDLHPHCEVPEEKTGVIRASRAMPDGGMASQGYA